MPNQIEVIEGFDQFGTSTSQLGRFYTVAGGLSLVDASSIVVEGRALQMPNGSACDITVPSDDEYYVGFHFWNSTSSQGNTLLAFREGSTNHVIFVINVDGTVTVSRNGSIPATSSVIGPFLANAPWFIEVYARIHDSTGAWEVRVNGVTVITQSGIDTRNGGTGIINNIRFLGGPSFTPVVDNVYCASGSAGFQGEGRVVTDMPVADGTHVDWTPSSGGDNYAMVDEQPADDNSTYNSSATATDRDSFDAATFGVTGTVKAVALAMQARKDDAGARNVQLSLRSGGTDYNGASHTLSTAYTGYQTIWVVDPDTGVAFVDTDIDGIEIGYENV